MHREKRSLRCVLLCVAISGCRPRRHLEPRTFFSISGFARAGRPNLYFDSPMVSRAKSRCSSWRGFSRFFTTWLSVTSRGDGQACFSTLHGTASRITSERPRTRSRTTSRIEPAAGMRPLPISTSITMRRPTRTWPRRESMPSSIMLCTATGRDECPPRALTRSSTRCVTWRARPMKTRSCISWRISMNPGCSAGCRRTRPRFRAK